MGDGFVFPAGLTGKQKQALDANALLDGTNYVAGIDDTAGGTGPGSGFTVTPLDFYYGDTSPVTIASVATGETIVSIRIDITQAFNAVSSLSVGHTGSSTALMNTDQNIPTVAGSFEVVLHQEYGGADTIKLYITPGSSSEGAGTCWLVTKKA